MVIPLPRNEVRAWYVFTDRFRSAERLAWCRSVLSAEELERCSRFAREKDRELYVIAHGLLRQILSLHADMEPTGWRFVKNEYGRPSVANPDFVRFRFNLSHTGGMVAWALGDDREVGIDVEDTERRSGGVELADRYFSPSEVADLMRVPEASRRRVFFDYWTLKEAYIKARGMGLAIPLDKFSFTLSPTSDPTIRFAPDLVDDPSRWHFATHSLGARHALAIAARKTDAEPVLLELREMDSVTLSAMGLDV